MNFKISYIVAIYNTEKYLKRCIESLISQTYKNTEILLIDDGSTDSCSKICNTYSQIYNNVFYYKKNNGGLSDARNFGIEAASGDYLIFVDSDDWCEPTQAEVLNNALISCKADICAFGYYNDFEFEKIFKEFSIDKHIKRGKIKIFEKEDIKNSIRALDDSDIFNTVWSKIYNRDFIEKNHLRFQIDGMPGEDLLFNSVAFKLANNVVLCNDLLYHYMFQDEVTLSRKYRNDLYEKNLKFCDARKSLYENYDMNDPCDIYQLAKCYTNYCFACIPNSFRKNAPRGYKNRVKIFKSLINNDVFIEYLKITKENNSQHKLLYTLLKSNCVFLCYLVYGCIMFVRNNTKTLYNNIRKFKYKEKMNYVSNK